MKKRKPKAIILENNDAVREHAAAILTNAGWDITCERVSKEALDTLSSSKKSSFALFISNFKLPKMEGDDILQKVKAISPLTQRMILTPADKPDTLINAVNKAEINACIITPFNDKDLINQAQTCFIQFKHAVKKEQLKRVIVHQNRQMYNIAQKLKKKDVVHHHLIDEKKARKSILRSQKRMAENKRNSGNNISLSSLVEQKGFSPDPAVFKNGFMAICETIKDLYDQVAAKNNLAPVALDPQNILSNRNPDDKSPSSDLVEKILKAAFTRALDKDIQPSETSPSPDDNGMHAEAGTLDDYFEISISESQTKARIKKIKDFDEIQGNPGLSDLLELLKQNQISYGILDDDAIEAWLSKSCIDEIVIATGEDPVHGRDGKIEFHFETNFTNPGKISEDGSIDFRERGNIPQVSKDDLLAVKTPAEEGKSGISVSGVPIVVNDVIDPVFVAGPGTELSEDECRIVAAIDGQPHLDALGSISVNPELTIPGDVDYETGNVNFKGNILVKGMIKEGFTVKGINLTANEIEGGIIDLTGDLNVSAGITEATISTHGTIYAKFINHSDIMGFGNIVISKEIIDSKVMLSGACINQAGHIISSHITAKMGVEAGKIGTSSSKPVTLKPGVDEHMETLKKQVDDALEATVYKVGLLKDEIKKLEDEDQELYRQISEKAQIQDQSQLKIKELKKKDATATSPQTSIEIKKLIKTAKDAEQELNTIFETQDNIAKQIEQIKSQIDGLEGKNKTHVLKKKALKDFSKKDTPQPVVTVAQTISQDSIIKGPNASLILKEDASRCKIQELAMQEDGQRFYDMIISDL